MMPSSWTGPAERRDLWTPMPFSQAVDSRVLLTRLRATLAEPGGGQERLDRIVRLVAEGLVAEVCSVYLRRDDRSLELCATEGLNPESVHLSRLRVGQGLVGQIAETAEPINTRDASHTRGFRYLPETGEEGLLELPRRAGPAARRGARRARRAEPRAARVHRRRGLRARGRRDGDRRDGRARRLRRPGRDGARPAAPAAVLRPRPRRPGGRRRGHRGAARAADRRRRPDQRRPDARDGPAARRDRGAARRGRRDAGRRLPDRERRASRRAERLPDVRPRQGLGAADGGVDRERPRRRGRGREGAVGDPRADDAASADPYLRERLHDLDDLSNRLLRLLAGNDQPQRPRAARRTRSSSRATSGRASCSTTAASFAASCSRRARSAATRRSSRGRWRSRWSSRRRASPARR